MKTSLSRILVIRIRSVTEQIAGDYSGDRMEKTEVISEAESAPQRKVECYKDGKTRNNLQVAAATCK